MHLLRDCAILKIEATRKLSIEYYGKCLEQALRVNGNKT